MPPTTKKPTEPHISELYDRIMLVMQDLKAQLKKTSQTQYGKAAISADVMMKEIRPIMSRHGIYLEMTEERLKEVERPKDYLLLITYAFRWVYKGVKTAPETFTQFSRVAKATDCGAIRTYAWKYYVRQSLLIATGDKDLDNIDSSLGYGQEQNPSHTTQPLPPRKLQNVIEFENMGFGEQAINVLSWIIGRNIVDSNNMVTPPNVKENSIIDRFKLHVMNFKGDLVKEVLEAMPQKDVKTFLQDKGLIQGPPTTRAEQKTDRINAINVWLTNYGFTSTFLDWTCAMSGVGLTPETLGKTQLLKVESFIKATDEALQKTPDLDVISEISSAIKNGLTPSKWLAEVK